MQNITLSKLSSKSVGTKPLDINTLVMTSLKPPTNNFTIEKLVRKRHQERLQLQALYEKIYVQCLQHIEQTDTMKKDNTIFEIPLLIYGNNNYNRKECLNFVNDKLKLDGLDTIVLYDAKIYISWAKIEEKYN